MPRRTCHSTQGANWARDTYAGVRAQSEAPTKSCILITYLSIALCQSPFLKAAFPSSFSTSAAVSSRTYRPYNHY